MTTLEATPLDPFGYEVKVGSIADIDAAAAEALRDLYRRDGLLLIRGLKLSQADQIALCRHLGPVNESQFENFLISNVDKSGHLGTRELLWHNDVPYLPAPYLGASLHALEVDRNAVGTRFASGYRAYESLPQALRDRIAGLKALQVRERDVLLEERRPDAARGVADLPARRIERHAHAPRDAGDRRREADLGVMPLQRAPVDLDPDEAPFRAARVCGGQGLTPDEGLLAEVDGPREVQFVRGRGLRVDQRLAGAELLLDV